MPPNRRKFTPIRVPLESELRKFRFANPPESFDMKIEDARGAIHGRLPHTRGYIKPSSVGIIENVRVKQDLADPTARVPGSMPLRPVLNSTGISIRDIDPPGYAYSDKAVLGPRAPMRGRLKERYSKEKGTAFGPLTTPRLKDYFETKAAYRHQRKWMDRIRNDPALADRLINRILSDEPDHD